MNGKILVFTYLILSIFFFACTNKEYELNSYDSNLSSSNKENGIDEFENTSMVTNESELVVALKESYSITLKNNITSNNDFIMEGEFTKTDTTEENKVINVRRHLNIFYIDSSNNIISNYILEAPSLIIKSKDVTIKGGKFIGNIYVERPGFILNDTKVEGDIYFKDEESKASFKLENTANISGKIEVKEWSQS